MMGEWTDKFNALPAEVRKIACIVELQSAIGALEIEKKRASKFHRAHMAEIDKKINTLQREMARISREADVEAG